MDKRIDKILNDNYKQFNDWINTINSYRNNLFGDVKLSEQENLDLTYKAVDVLAKITELFLQYGRFKDDWDYSKMYLNIYGPELLINSLKTETRYSLGFDIKGIYLNTYLRHSEYLKNMDDDFWSDFLILSKLGEFELIEHEMFGKEIENKYFDLFQTNKGNIYRLFRKFFISSVEGKDHILLDDFRVLWTPQKGIETLIEEGCVAFKLMYKLNYSLWKFYDLANKKR